MSSRGSALADVRDGALAAASRLGWTCLDAMVNLRTGTMRLSFLHQSGRIVTLSAAASGAASITREQRDRHTATTGRRGDRAIVERVSVWFIGRDRYADAVEGLRALAHYMADNRAPRLGATNQCELGEGEER